MKSTNTVNSAMVDDFFKKQIATWPLACENYKMLKKVENKTMYIDRFSIKIQHNPARIKSSGAKLDESSIKNRKCFLCQKNLPAEQIILPVGDNYLILCNPFPIFPQHFTIANRKHTDQLILPHINDMLEITRQLNKYTIFYNGPRSGASAPDHAHFQACTRSYMPIDEDVEDLLTQQSTQMIHKNNGSLYAFSGYIRNGFVIESSVKETACELFKQLYHSLKKTINNDEEPMMNIFSYYSDKAWRMVIIPRKKHRPWQYDAAGDEHLLASPGAADIGGLFIMPLRKDFERISPAILQDIYQQVCFNDEEIALLNKNV